MLNRYYKTQEEYLFAIGEAMREEYKAIVDAGFLVQIDDPRLVSYYLVNPAATIAECRKWAVIRVEALNHALRGIPPEKIRHHTCYGINMGPRVHDMEVKHLIDIILKINAGADRKSTRLNSSHQIISYAVFCLKKKKHFVKLTHLHAH